jgi:pteridine reductase
MPETQQHRLALVTGGARRVGRAIVQRLAASGFDIAFSYLHSEREAQEVIAMVQSHGRECVAIKADLTQVAAIAQVHAAVESLGPLSVLVNSASIYEPDGLSAGLSPQSTSMWKLHVEAPLLLCQRFEKRLRQTRGHVVNMVDSLAERPWPKYMAYSASKAGLWNLTLGLARELAPEVTVNGIAPGVVEWPDDYPESEREKYLRRVPLGRAGTPEDVAELVDFLCTGGSYITGQIIRLDGGRSIT